MSLLILDTTEERMKLVQKIFDRQFASDKKLEKEYSDYRKRMMLKDINYNLETLETSVKFRSYSIFSEYTLWLLQLLAGRMQDLGEQRVREQMVAHYQILKEVLGEKIQGEEREETFRQLDMAINLTREAKIDFEEDKDFSEGALGKIRETFLELLIKSDKNGARKIIEDCLEEGLTLEEIYLDIFQKVLIKIGDLWHQGKINVAQEHFSTALIQNIMAQLYPKIFSRPRNDRVVLACCTGNELHEMAARMVCDLLEMKGWDSVYLGAGVPQDSLFSSIEENKPDLIVLSVTMPIYLGQCKGVVDKLKNKKEGLKPLVALGGRAFTQAPRLPEKWGADIFAPDGLELSELALRRLKET